MKIIPAIIGEDFIQVKEKLEKVKGLTEWVQIDIVDGKFAEPETWGAKIGNHLHLWEPVALPHIELHLMVQRPEVGLADWVSTNVDRILIHVESEGDKAKLIKQIKDGGVQAGLVLKLETPLTVVEPFIPTIDVVQFMSIATIGSYGAPFDERVYEKISSLRKKYPNVTISIDGGVNLDNAKKLIDAGANNLVIGSAIWKSGNLKEAIEQFKQLE